ncbi:MAG: hypothetical protein CMJ64_12745 [Planctomycetaceae bacterium]|nr:hypothetical protein [Planctomycetaceae bacterium]
MTGLEPNSVVILFKGGRLPSWHQLSDAERSEFEQTHVNLMLSIAEQHGMSRLEGFRLIGRQGNWQRFWLIEFPTMEGAETWIRAEMAPPYGLYGHYEYHLSRPLDPSRYSAWVTKPAAASVPRAADPHTIPELKIDPSSIVVLMFARYLPGAEALTPDERGDARHIALMQDIARKHGLMRIEGVGLLSPQADWHRAWIIELPTLEAAEAWVEAEEALPHGMHAHQTIHLARKWAPEYFANWTKRY